MPQRNIETKTFPKTVIIKSKYVEGVPDVPCQDIMGVALRAVGDNWDVQFPYIKDREVKMGRYYFHKNNLEVIA